MIPTLWIFIPTSLTNMFKAFSPYNFMGLSFGMWRADQVVDDDWAVKGNGEAATYNFDKMDFTTNAWLLNCTPVLIILCYISFIHPVLSCSWVIFGSINYIWNLDWKWKDTFCIMAIFFTFFIFCFNSMLNFWFFNVETDNEWANSLCAMFCLSACFCFLVYLFFNLIIFWFELRWKKRDGKPIDDPVLILTDNFRARIIFWDFKKTSFVHYSYWVLWVLWRILHCTIFTFWYEDGYS